MLQSFFPSLKQHVRCWAAVTLIGSFVTILNYDDCVHAFCVFQTAKDEGTIPPQPEAIPVLCQGPIDQEFEYRIWNRILAPKCLPCHCVGGDAEESRFLLSDLKRVIGQARDKELIANRRMLLEIATSSKDSEATGQVSRVLLKATGELSHGGGVILDVDDPLFVSLENYLHHSFNVRGEVAAHEDHTPERSNENASTFWEGVRFLEDRSLLRRAMLSLVGRIPSLQEIEDFESAAQHNRELAFREMLTSLMSEEPFYERLREGFNDIFLLTAVDDNAEVTALSYEHFEQSRLWYQHEDFGHIADKREREQAGYKLANDYREALLREPMMLIDYIVRNDRPFTELVTADYIMVSPYTAKGYGVYEEVREAFRDPNNPFEYVPVRLKALRGRNRSEDQESTTGFFPHAGMLTTFLYLARYPTTETNRNRLRSRVVYQHFLGVDVLELAARVSDAAAINAQYEIPTMQAADCVVCHRTLEPVAGLYQDYWRFETNFALYGKRKGGWFTDMFGAGFEGENLPETERWRSLAWFAERIAADPRFAVTMTEHVYYILMGRKVLKLPTNFNDPLYSAKLRAYRVQRTEIERIAQRFYENGFNLKDVFCDLVLSDFYRVDSIHEVVQDPCRLAELDDVGVFRMLAPEQLERKIHAVFGAKWNKLDAEMGMLYGGIDLKEVTERAADPSGAMGAIQRILSNEIACKHVAADFALPRQQRRLFPFIDSNTVPGTPEARMEIERSVVHLHGHILGQPDAPEFRSDILRTINLFEEIVRDARENGIQDPREIWSCRQGEAVTDDPHYTIRAWRGVVTYLLRRPEFLYE